MWTRITAVLVALGVMAGSAALAETRQVTGSVTYLQRIALPDGAVLAVSLREMAETNGSWSKREELSADQIQMQGVPMTFSLPYDPAQIAADKDYSVHAEIRLEGRLIYVSPPHNPVLTKGGGEAVDIIVSSVPASLGGLQGTEWTVTMLGGQALELDRPQTLAFGEQDGVSAFGGCNRFVGTAEAKDGVLKVSDRLAGTLMACPDALMTMERAFLKALESAVAYEQVGEELVLKDAEGAVLIRARKGI